MVKGIIQTILNDLIIKVINGVENSDYMAPTENNILEIYGENTLKRKYSEVTEPPTPKRMCIYGSDGGYLEYDSDSPYARIVNPCGECGVDMGEEEYSQLCGGHYCIGEL